MNLSKEERLSHYIDKINLQIKNKQSEEPGDQELNELIDTVHLIKISNLIEMPTLDFQEKVRQRIKEEVMEKQQNPGQTKPLNNRTWKKFLLPIVAACLVVISVCLPTLTSNQKAEADQIRVVKEEQLVSLGVTMVNNPIVLSDGKNIGFEKNERIVTWNLDDQLFKEYPLVSFQYMRSPEWSPDEKMVTFSGYKTKNAGIWLMNQDGTNLRLLAAPESPDEFYDHPTWSPDGKKIAFAKQRYTSNDSHGYTQASEEIWVIDIDTGKLTKITDGSEPSWSPNGKDIAFTKTGKKGSNSQKEVWLINTDGSNSRKLTVGMEPNWSPDGQFITFVKNTTKRQKVNGEKQKIEVVSSFRDIWAIHVDSKKESHLTESKINEQELNHLISSSKSESRDVPLKLVMNGQYSDWQPSWSKDGKTIIFVRDINEEKGNHFSLMKIDLKYE